MKRNLYTLFLLALSYMASGQLVITEIMYNSPESGTDSLEFIEFYNSTNAAINLEGYSFEGVEMAFTADHSIAANGYFVIAVKSSALQKVYNVNAVQWTAGALTNGGETIRLKDSAGAIIDEVTYDDGGNWPAAGIGTGASLVLCDLTADNSVAANWSGALNKVGPSIAGKKMKGSPGQANTASCTWTPDYTIEARSNNTFSPKDITVDLEAYVRFVNKGGHHNVNGSITTFPNNPVGFSNGDPSSDAWTYDVTFNTKGLYQYQCDPHAGVGMTGSITVGQDAYPKYSIPTVTSTNSTGKVDSLDVTCQVEGIVYGINLRGTSGLQFTIIDENNNGIATFSASQNFGYTVKEGDKVEIKGTINQFNGLTQMALDSVKLKSSNNSLVTPKSVALFEENDESSLIKISNVTYVDVTQWKGDGSSFNVDVTDGTTTFTVRIDNDVALSTMPAPQAPLDIIGLLGQFDSSSPYSSGYQLLPRWATDVISVSATSGVPIQNLTIAPNPFNDVITAKADEKIVGLKLYDAMGKLMLSSTENQLHTANINPGFYLLAVEGQQTTNVIKVVKQ